jgi:tetratricopeptide (TPR) repeat protein
MSSPHTPLIFFMSVGSYDSSDLPVDCRDVSSAEFRNAVAESIRKTFAPFGGDLEILIDQRAITVKWFPSTKSPTPLDLAFRLLKSRNLQEAVSILETLLKAAPNSPEILRNLGMALSDLRQLDRAIQLLNRATQLDEENVDAWTSLGVGLYRNGNKDKAAEAFERALALDPRNTHAHRNYGVFLADQGRLEEAEEHFRTALASDPRDAQSLFGLAVCLRKQDRVAEADEFFQKVIAVDPDCDIAELSRTESRGLAEAEFKRRGITGLRMDAVFYCLAAMQHFQKLSKQQVQQLGFEIALLGQQGLDVNDPQKSYTIKSMPGQHSGLKLVSYMYVAFQQIGPKLDLGFDLSKEHEAALGLFRKKKL